MDVRLPRKRNSSPLGARLVHLIITMIKCIRTSRMSIKNSPSTDAPQQISHLQRTPNGSGSGTTRAEHAQGHLPRVLHHQIYKYSKIQTQAARTGPGSLHHTTVSCYKFRFAPHQCSGFKRVRWERMQEYLARKKQTPLRTIL